jgi:predicted nuclease of predicted toxin-antitoxin system
MNLYLDDDTVDGVLVKLLRAAGHDVVIPADVGTAGKKDAAHFREAIARGRVTLTHNHNDFVLLHLLVRFVGGHHPGVLTIRKDNDPKRDMSQRQIVRAIRKFESSGVPLADDLHVLNNYR